MKRNDELPAGAPMHFACVGCGWPITVPELYVVKPASCPRCGGEWSEIDAAELRELHALIDYRGHP